MSDLIRTHDLTRTFKVGDIEVQALRKVSLNIAEGAFVAIMGPSGSGKSTFMNLLGCLDTPTSGTYYLDGIDVSRLSRDERAEIRNSKIGFVFQQFNLLPRTSALENVQLPLLYSTRNEGGEREKALRVLDIVGLSSVIDHHPNQMSGGQQQRVAIARSLINDPKLILADEPTGALDSRTSFEIMALFQRLNRERGITIVLVTHEPDIANHAERIIRFRDGAIVEDELVRQPIDATSELSTDTVGLMQ